MKQNLKKSLLTLALGITFISGVSAATSVMCPLNGEKKPNCTKKMNNCLFFGISKICSKNKIVVWKPYFKGVSLFSDVIVADGVTTMIMNEKDQVQVTSTGDYTLKICLGNNKFKDIKISKGTNKFSLKDDIAKKTGVKGQLAGTYSGTLKMNDKNCVSCHATATITKEDDKFVLNFIVYKKAKKLIYKFKAVKAINGELKFEDNKFKFIVKNGKISGDLIKKDACIAKVKLSPEVAKKVKKVEKK